MLSAWGPDGCGERREGRQMNLGTRSGTCKVPANPYYFARAANTGGDDRAAMHCSIWMASLVKNKQNTSAPARPRSPHPFATYGLNEVITIDAPHNERIWRARNKPEQRQSRPHGVPAIVDACRSLQIPRPRRPKRIYRECAATLVRTRADFAPPLVRVRAEFGPS